MSNNSVTGEELTCQPSRLTGVGMSDLIFTIWVHGPKEGVCAENQNCTVMTETFSHDRDDGEQKQCPCALPLRVIHRHR